MVTVPFTGSSVQVFGGVGANHGAYGVSLDGATQVAFDGSTDPNGGYLARREYGSSCLIRSSVTSSRCCASFPPLQSRSTARRVWRTVRIRWFSPTLTTSSSTSVQVACRVLGLLVMLNGLGLVLPGRLRRVQLFKVRHAIACLSRLRRAAFRSVRRFER